MINVLVAFVIGIMLGGAGMYIWLEFSGRLK